MSETLTLNSLQPLPPRDGPRGGASIGDSANADKLRSAAVAGYAVTP
jgi:hypothetical protein